MDDLISVIIPAYNAEKYMDRCLNSIVKQSYNNLQIIVVNDGSTDNTKKILEKFAEAHRPHKDSRRDRVDRRIHDSQISEDSLSDGVSEDTGI